MIHNTTASTRANGTVMGVFLVALFIVLIGGAAASMAVGSQTTSPTDGGVIYESEAGGEMTVTASMVYNVDYLLVEADEESELLTEVGDDVTVDTNGENVNVYTVVDGDTTHIQTLTYDSWVADGADSLDIDVDEDVQSISTDDE